MCAMTHSHAWHNSFILCVCDMTHSPHCLDLYVQTRDMYMLNLTSRVCDITHSHACHDSFVCVTRLILMRDTTPSFWVCVTWSPFARRHTHTHTHTHAHPHTPRTRERTSRVPQQCVSLARHKYIYTHKYVYIYIYKHVYEHAHN